ncbi:MAG: hypothetical protein WDA60_15340 [Acidimicrobiia bacterium]|jgi:hypothetical protein
MTRRVPALIALPLAAIALMLGGAPAFAASGDQQIADQGIIVAGDVPGTWTASPNDTSGDAKNLKVAAKTKGCADYVKFAKANRATTEAVSDDYSSSSDEQISNHSYVHRSAAVAGKVIDAFGSSAVPGCLSNVFTTAIKTQLAKSPKARTSISGVDLTLEPVDLGNTGVPTVAYEGTLSIRLKDGTSQDLDVGLVAVQIDRVILTYSIQAPIDATEIQSVVGTALTNTITRTANAL